MTRFPNGIDTPFIAGGGGPAPGGKVFFVNASSGAENQDVPWFNPTEGAYTDLQSAIDDCVDNRGDVIYVKRGGLEVTSAVNFNKRGLSVIGQRYGMNPTARGEDTTIYAASSYTDGPAAKITKPCYIEGLGFAGRETSGGESLLIDCDETGGFSGGFAHLRHCRFSAWYGAMDAFIRALGGQLNRIEGCTFDGLFGGVGDAAIVLETDNLIDPGFYQILGNYFYEMGSGKHALKIGSGDTGVGLLVAHNYLMAGFGGNQGKFADLNSTDSYGMFADNWLAPLANQAAAFENIGSYAGGFADNHYEEA